MGWLYWILGIVALLVAIIVIWIFAVRSHFSGLTYECEDKYSVVDRFIKKRYELIPALIEAVQEYAAHETAIIEELITLRNRSIAAASLMEKCEIESELTDALRRLFASAEKYQPLRISAVFVTMKNDLRAVEQDIVNAGEQYNRQVKAYNNYYDQAVPNGIATLFKLKKLAECDMQITSIEE